MQGPPSCRCSRKTRPFAACAKLCDFAGCWASHLKWLTCMEARCSSMPHLSGGLNYRCRKDPRP
eukprot:6242676-Amphidinium_carterae.1